MGHWLDLALISDEDELTDAIAGLDGDERDQLLRALVGVLNADEDRVLDGLLRLLVERARPLALPARLWARPVTSSDDPRDLIRRHFEVKGFQVTSQRVKAADRLYTRFLDERAKTSLGERELIACQFRCQHCGLAFCNEQLQDKGIVSRLGNRGKDKRDPRKPHWNFEPRMRLPTHDHVWPITTFGDNTSSNLKVLCAGCNRGKENVLALEQVRAWTGLVSRTSLLHTEVVDWVPFYAQLREEPVCSKTGKGPDEVELTVKLIDPDAPPVLGNLRTVESPGL